MNLTALLDGAGPWTHLLVFLLTAAETSAFLGILVPGKTVLLVAAGPGPAARSTACRSIWRHPPTHPRYLR